MKKFLSLTLSVLMMLVAIPFVNTFITEDVSIASASEAQVKTADIYLVAGQSNAAGYSDFYRADGTTLNLSNDYASKANTYINGFENVLYYGSADSRNFDLQNVKLGQGITDIEFGPELGMAEYLNDKYSTDDSKAVIIKCARGGASIIGSAGSSQGNWLAPSYAEATGRTVTGVDLYTKMMGSDGYEYSNSMIYSAINELKEQGYNNFNFKAMLWLQGEAEVVNETVANLHGEALSAFIDDLRKDVKEIAITAKLADDSLNFSDASNMNFLISEVAPSFNNGYADYTCVETVIEAQRALAQNKENVDSFSTYEYNISHNASGYASTTPNASYCSDAFHYCADDMLAIGYKAGSMMYAYTVGESISVEQPTGVWFNINGYSAIRTVNDGISSFKSRFNSKIELSYSNTVSSNGDLVVNYSLTDGYIFGTIGYEDSGVTYSSEHITVEDGVIVVDGEFLAEKLNGLDVFNLVVTTVVDPSKTPKVINNSEEIIKVVFIDAPEDMKYYKGDYVKFKVYLTSHEYAEQYNLTLCKGKGKLVLEPDADGIFSFIVSAKDTSCDIEVTASLKGQSSSISSTYELVVDPSIPEPEPEIDAGTDGEIDSEVEPDEDSSDNQTSQTPSDSTLAGLSCAMSVNGDVSTFLVIVLAMLIVVVRKSRRMAK